jgi:tryptophan halogenase
MAAQKTDTFEAVRSVVITGGGVAGWTTAAALAQAFRAVGKGSVRLVTATGDEADLGRADAATPEFAQLLSVLGVDEDALIREDGATFSLASRFDGWPQDGASSFQAWGEAGATLGPVQFHHFVLRLGAEGKRRAVDDFSLGALAARSGRFRRPDPDPRSILSTLAYGLHLDLDAWARRLRGHAMKLGVTETAGAVAEVAVADGGVQALVLESGERIEADLFIDCTATGRLMEALGVAWRDDGMPFDRVVEVVTADSAPPAPFAVMTATPQGWRRTIPLQGRLAEALVCTGDVKASAEAVATPFRSGRRARAWSGNCIAIGPGAAELGPLHGARLRLLQSGILRLLSLFPWRGRYEVSAAEYERVIASETDRLRDFVLMHYVSNRRSDPVWAKCRDLAISDGLAYKIRLFESRGRVSMFDEEPVSEGAWAEAMLSMGRTPRRYDPLADALPRAALDQTLSRMRALMDQAVAAMPAHADYIRSLGAASIRETVR